MTSAREAVENAVEALIALLDGIDGDADLEDAEEDDACEGEGDLIYNRAGE